VRSPLADPLVAWPSTTHSARYRLGQLIPGTPINDGFLLIAFAAILIVSWTGAVPSVRAAPARVE